jgi:hypothetical protein
MDEEVGKQKQPPIAPASRTLTHPHLYKYATSFSNRQKRQPKKVQSLNRYGCNPKSCGFARFFP